MDKIVKDSYNKVLNDESFVRLTFYSLLPYSLLFVGYVFYQTYFFINTLQHGFDFSELKNYIDKVFSFGADFTIPFIITIVVGLIGYFLIPPIAEGALISYLDKKKGIGASLGKGFVKFFPLFELHGFLSIFSFLFFIVITSRIVALDLMDNTFILPLVIIWGILVLFFSFSSFYAKYLIVLENMDFFEALKESIKLSFLNIGKTLKYFGIYILLYLRYILNVIILVGIPLTMLYIFLKLDYFEETVVKYITFTIMGLLFLLTAYVNGIVEAFFLAMWYEVFKSLDRED